MKNLLFGVFCLPFLTFAQKIVFPELDKNAKFYPEYYNIIKITDGKDGYSKTVALSCIGCSKFKESSDDDEKYWVVKGEVGQKLQFIATENGKIIDRVYIKVSDIPTPQLYINDSLSSKQILKSAPLRLSLKTKEVAMYNNVISFTIQLKDTIFPQKYGSDFPSNFAALLASKKRGKFTIIASYRNVRNELRTVKGVFKFDLSQYTKFFQRIR